MKNWPADNVIRSPLDRLIPYANNARIHSDAQIAQIAASMKEWGWTNPVLIEEDGGIIAGHGRVLAARKLGLTEAPVMVATGWTDAQKRAYVLADNQLALNASWNLEALSVELQGLDALGFNLTLLGFGDLAALMVDRTAGLTDPDEAPEAPVNPASVTGDVWLLGKHRLVCGDATNAEDVARALNGVEPHLMVTDPPYGVDYSAGWRNVAMPYKTDPKRWKDGAGRATGAVANDSRSDWREVWALFPGDVAYCWHAPQHASTVQDGFEATGFTVRSQIIWAKSHFAIGRGHYHVQHEPCLYLVRSGATGHWVADRKQTTLWQIDKPIKSETGHSTQKPVECMKRPIENNSSPGQAVYEPFSGSGTTIIAAEMTGRICHAIEIMPAYIDVAVKRWQAFTGKAAMLEGDGRTFEAISQERYDIATREKDYEASCVVGTADMREKLLNGRGTKASRQATVA